MRWLIPVLVLGACGDGGGSAPADAGADAACADPSREPTGIGEYSSPAAFDRSMCTPGALDGLDPSDLWIARLPELDREQGLARIDLGCPGLLVRSAGVFGLELATDAQLTADDLYWRTRISIENNVFTDAFDLCARDGDALVGRYARCYEGMGETDCVETELVLEPFRRLPGESEAEGLELVAEHGDHWPPAFTANVRVHEGIAYVARGSDGLRIVDVSDPASPVDLARVGAQSDDFNDIKIIETAGGATYALVASAVRGVLVIHVSDPTEPELVATFTPSGEANHGVHSIFVDETDGRYYAYLADGYSSLLGVWDVTEPELPELWLTYELPDSNWGIHDLYADDHRAYLNATYGGLVIVDLAPSPGVSTVVGRYSHDQFQYSHSSWVTTAGGRTIAVTGDEGYDAHLHVVDVDPASPAFTQRLGGYQTRSIVSIHNIMTVGERAYVSYYLDGVRILDLSDPAAPELVAYFNSWDREQSMGELFEGAVGIDVDPAAGLVYVADTPRGLLILRETAPAP